MSHSISETTTLAGHPNEAFTISFHPDLSVVLSLRTQSRFLSQYLMVAFKDSLSLCLKVWLVTFIGGFNSGVIEEFLQLCNVIPNNLDFCHH